MGTYEKLNYAEFPARYVPIPKHPQVHFSLSTCGKFALCSKYIKSIGKRLHD